MSHWHLRRAARWLKAGGVIAYPTEAVYGIGCDPHNLSAVTRLLHIKQRDWRKGLILVAADFAQLEPFLLPLCTDLQARVFSAWPGPVTWLLPARPQLSPLLRGTHNTLAVRVSAHPLVKDLCQTWQGALVSTSANLSRQTPAKTRRQVQQRLGQTLDWIVPGAVGGHSKPSEIREALSNRTVRAG